jgi:Lrp/AsnC family leucine-responsive transcriptional regulator
MKSANHASFIHLLNNRNEVVEAHRISGEGCYHLTIKVASQEQLNHVLNQLLDHGNYSLNLSVQKIKQRSALDATFE